MKITSRLLVVGALVTAGMAGVQSAPAQSGSGLSDGFAFVVPPVKVTPDRSALPGQVGKPFFREPSLAATKEGLVTVFTEAAPGNINGPTWSCGSRTGSQWSCRPIDSGPVYVKQVDPWVVGTGGEACPRYRDAVTMTEFRDPDIVVFTSRDLGGSWDGPIVVVPRVSDDGDFDGEKIFFDGQRTFVAYRNFNGFGQFVSRLGTEEDPCAWSPPVAIHLEPVFDGDHPRLAASRTPGVLAVRGALPGTVAGGLVQTFSQVQTDLTVNPRDVVMTVTTQPSLIQAFCEGGPPCSTAVDAGATLLYDPVRRRYLSVYTDGALPSEGLPGDLVTRMQTSTDDGRTWSSAVAIAGSGSDGSPQGAASMQPNLAWDPVLSTVVLDYYEKPTRDSDQVELRARVMRPDGSWSPPVTLDRTPFLPSPSRPVGVLPGFGDYTGLQACGGVMHVMYQKLGPGPSAATLDPPSSLTGFLSYAAVRFAEPSGAQRLQAARTCSAPAAPVVEADAAPKAPAPEEQRTSEGPTASGQPDSNTRSDRLPATGASFALALLGLGLSCMALIARHRCRDNASLRTGSGSGREDRG